MTGKPKLDLARILESALDEPIEAIRKASTFHELSGWDSLKYVRLVIALQTEYGVELQPEEIERLTSWTGVREVLAARGAQP